VTPEPTHQALTVLVLCTGNSCRSQMAEALLCAAFPGRVRALSAGTRPQPAVAPQAILALQELGLPTSTLHPKDISAVIDQDIDLVVTVCDNAQESCPVFPRQTTRLHMSLPDPHGQSLEAFVRVRDAISERLVPAVREALGLKE
jgi:arsenate reductase